MPRIFEAPPGFVLNPDYLVPELRAQRDALLEACRTIVQAFDALPSGDSARMARLQINAARAAIKAVEGEKT